MNKKWLVLAADFLEKASDEFSNHGCNDWEFPENWTTKEKVDFVRDMYRDNGNIHEFDSGHLNVPDWWVISFLAKRILLED